MLDLYFLSMVKFFLQKKVLWNKLYLYLISTVFVYVSIVVTEIRLENIFNWQVMEKSINLDIFNPFLSVLGAV